MVFKNIKLLTILVGMILLVLFFPFNFKNVNVLGDDIEDQWPLEYKINSNQVWEGKIEINQSWLIASDGELTIKPGTEIIFHPSTAIFVKGKLDGRGQITNLIKIHGVKSDSQYTIKIFSDGEARIMNAEISQGGGTLEAFFSMEKTFWQKVYALVIDRIGAISVDSGGFLECQNCFFHNNKIAIYAGSVFNNGINNISKVMINRSSFNDNEKDIYKENVNGEFNFRYNWWGDKYGPKVNKIVGTNINTDYWREKKDFKDPVVIIPGILGSQKIDGQWKIDPILKRYDKLYDIFLKNGYKKNRDIFTFPYDWHLDNIHTAKLLKEKILEIKKKTNWPKVDVVAHSMGGLVAREYIESDYYGDDINQLVLLGTPHLGAPKDYLIYQQGEKGFNKLGIAYYILKYLFKQEASEKGYKNIYDYIHNYPISSVKELLPIYDYIYLLDADEYVKSDKAVYNLLSYPYNYPHNEFLENLNKEDNLNKLKLVDKLNIIGKNDNTITGINSLGLNGHNGVAVAGFQELRFGDGDGTVPVKSAKGIESDTLIETNFLHSKLPEKTAKIVYKNIAGKNPVKEINSVEINNIFIIMVFSPIDIQIIAPDGKRVGKNFATGGYYNEIEGAYYTGYKTDTEFITIPNPIDGEYKILTQGTDTGSYKIEVIDISQNDKDEVSEQTISFEGETITDGKGEHSLEIKNGTELKIQADDEADNDDSNDGDINTNITNSEVDNIIADNEQENDVDNDGNTIIENDDSLNNNSSNKKHKKHKKKSKHKKTKNKLALVNMGTENNSNSNNNENIKNQKDKNKNINKNLSKENNQNNSVMGEETKSDNDSGNSEKQNNDKNSNKSFYAFGAVVLLGIILAIGNLFGWLKIKKNKETGDDF